VRAEQLVSDPRLRILAKRWFKRPNDGYRCRTVGFDGTAALLESYRVEAGSLFSANQDARRAAERTAFFVLTLVGAIVTAGITSHSSLVALALSPLVLMLMSYMCQQFVDVTVLGAARRVLERRIAEIVGRPVLIYELAVAPVRRERPFGAGVRIMNVATGLVVVGAVAAGIVVAAEGQRWYWEVAFVSTTLISGVSFLASFWDMHRAANDAQRLIEARLAEVT
jgi:hypothetical protein